MSFMVGLAFAVAASANFPALLLALTWRRFNTTGAVTGVLFGVISSVGAGDHQPDRVAGAGLRGRPVLVVRPRQPGDHQHPARVHRLLARHHAGPRAREEHSFDELWVRSETGLGAEVGTGLTLTGQRSAGRHARAEERREAVGAGDDRSGARAPGRRAVRGTVCRWPRPCSPSSTSPASRRRRSRTSCARAGSTSCASSSTRARRCRTGASSPARSSWAGRWAPTRRTPHPWLVGEKRVIRRAGAAGHPVWGVCLGAQLLAAALGAAVYPGAEAEVGPAAGRAHRRGGRTTPSSRDAPASFPTLQWHGDTFDLPDRGDAAGQLTGLPQPGVRVRARLRRSSSTSRCRRELAARVGGGARRTPRASRRSGGPARSTAWSTR